MKPVSQSSVSPSKPIFALQSLVVEGEQPAVFEVRRSDAPAALQVPIEVVVDDPAQGIVGRVPRRAAHLRVGGIFVEPKLHGIEDAAREIAVAAARCALVLRRLVKRRAQQGHLGEIVEVPGLQRGILPVVGEAEELAGLGLEDRGRPAAR